MFGSSWQKEQSTPKSLLIDFIVSLSSSLEMVLGRIPGLSNHQRPPEPEPDPALAAAAGGGLRRAAAGGAAWGSAKTAWVKRERGQRGQKPAATLGFDVNIGSRSPRAISYCSDPEFRGWKLDDAAGRFYNGADARHQRGSRGALALWAEPRVAAAADVVLLGRTVSASETAKKLHVPVGGPGTGTGDAGSGASGGDASSRRPGSAGGLDSPGV